MHPATLHVSCTTTQQALQLRQWQPLPQHDCGQPGTAVNLAGSEVQPTVLCQPCRPYCSAVLRATSAAAMPAWLLRQPEPCLQLNHCCLLYSTQAMELWTGWAESATAFASSGPQTIQRPAHLLLGIAYQLSNNGDNLHTQQQRHVHRDLTNSADNCSVHQPKRILACHPCGTNM